MCVTTEDLLSPSHPVSLCLSHSVSNGLTLSSNCLTPSHSVSNGLTLSSNCLTLSVSLCLSHSLSQTVSLCLTPSHSVSPRLTLSHPVLCIHRWHTSLLHVLFHFIHNSSLWLFSTYPRFLLFMSISASPLFISELSGRSCPSDNVLLSNPVLPGYFASSALLLVF